MKRRTFCAAVVVASAIPISVRKLLAATGGGIPAVSRTGKQIVLGSTDIADFRSSLRGELLLPGQESYERSRKVWNGAFDRRPALIARCAGAADVIQAVAFGRAQDLLVDVLSAEEIRKCDEVATRNLAPDCAHWLKTGELAK